MVELDMQYIDTNNTKDNCNLGAYIFIMCFDDRYLCKHWRGDEESDGKDLQEYKIGTILSVYPDHIGGDVQAN